MIRYEEGACGRKEEGGRRRTGCIQNENPHTGEWGEKNGGGTRRVAGEDHLGPGGWQGRTQGSKDEIPKV